jgi:hypothetical protein
VEIKFTDQHSLWLTIQSVEWLAFTPMALIGLLIPNTDTRKMFVTFDPKTGYIGVIAVVFVGLNEICFVPYEKLTYITDIISSIEMGAQTYHVH